MKEYGKWYYVDKEGPPPDGVVVIVEYSGFWPCSGNGGITDLYWWDSDWFNYPEGVKIKRWMWIPE